jgi:hypothetical protein
MKTNEYRIGNYVSRDGNIMKVVAINERGLSLELVEKATGQQTNSGRTVPILLTEVWMPILGFKQYSQLKYRWTFPNKEITYDLDDNCIQIGGSWDWKKIKYVHEMQNLIYELIKKEI